MMTKMISAQQTDYGLWQHKDFPQIWCGVICCGGDGGVKACQGVKDRKKEAEEVTVDSRKRHPEL